MAIFDGERTLLFRHPSPPDAFVPLPGRNGVFMHEGRFEAVVANSSAEIGGVPTATLMPAGRAATARQHAAILLHEAFHVYQRHAHPAWTANEAELFTYPVEDAGALALRRVEWRSLHRALVTPGERGHCHAAAAVQARAERFARVPPGAVAYERGLELFEGLAEHVQHLVLDTPDDRVLDSSRELPAEAVRTRAYRSGAALARLLHRADPSWRETLASEDSISLDALLSRTLNSRGAVGDGCRAPAEERAALLAAAEAEIESMQRERTAARDEFVQRSGPRIVMIASDPLFPQGFDPLNVRRVAPAELLHSRYVRLGNAAGFIEVIGRASLTVAAGDHPLFQGVSRVEITGLAEAPAVTVQGGRVLLRAPGVTADFRGAGIGHSGDTLTVTLASGEGA